MTRPVYISWRGFNRYCAVKSISKNYVMEIKRQEGMKSKSWGVYQIEANVFKDSVAPWHIHSF